MRPQQEDAASGREIRVPVPADRDVSEIQKKLDEIAAAYPGNRPVTVSVTDGREIFQTLHAQSGVRPSDDLYMALFDLTGGEERSD